MKETLCYFKTNSKKENVMFYALIRCRVPWMRTPTSSSAVGKWSKWPKRRLQAPTFPTLLKHGPRRLSLWPLNCDFQPASGENHWQLVSLQSPKVNSLFFWPWWLVTVQWKKLRRWNLLWKARTACVYRAGAEASSEQATALACLSWDVAWISSRYPRERKNKFTFLLKSCFFESFAHARGKSPPHRLR